MCMQDMGGCGSKPKVELKEHENEQYDEHKTPEVEDKDSSQLSVFHHEILREDLGDHQSDHKRPSLSYLFHQVL